MRTDIKMDVDNGDINFLNTPPAASSTLEWVAEDDLYVYGECVIANYLDFESLSSGIGLTIPRKDSTKEIRIKFSSITTHEESVSTQYYSIVTGGGDLLTAAKLPVVSDKLYFRVYLMANASSAILTDGYWKDLNIEESLSQNEFFLLMSSPSSIYEYPLMGVGIQKYLNGDIQSSNLPSKIQTQFELDGMSVSEIQFNKETDELVINSTEN